MCASFQLIVPYTSHWTWGVRFYEDSRTFFLHFLMETRKAFWLNIQRIFSSYSPLRMRSAFGKKSEHFFEKLFLTLHYRGFESRLGEKTENFFWKIFCSYYLLEVNSRFGRKLLNFPLFTCHRTWEVRLVPNYENSFRYSYWEMGEAFWRRIPKLCPYTSQRTWEVRLGEKIGNFFEFFLFPFSTGGEMPKWSAFRKISLPHLHGKNVNPHYPLEAWSAFEQKTEKLLIQLWEPLKTRLKIFHFPLIFSIIKL